MEGDIENNKIDANIIEEWETFRKTGLLWWINMILHTFGWSIIYVYDNNKLVNVYPSRVKYRGFSEKQNTDGYIKVSKYLLENIEQIEKESKE